MEIKMSDLEIVEGRIFFKGREVSTRVKNLRIGADGILRKRYKDPKGYFKDKKFYIHECPSCKGLRATNDKNPSGVCFQCQCDSRTSVNYLEGIRNKRQSKYVERIVIEFKDNRNFRGIVDEFKQILKKNNVHRNIIIQALAVAREELKNE